MQGRGENFGWTLALEFTPAAIFGTAAALSVAERFALPQFEVMPLGIGLASFVAAWLVLRIFRGMEPAYPMPRFDLGELDREFVAVTRAAREQEFEFEELDEFELDEFFEPPEDFAEEDELVLEDVLAAIEPGSRVVRLFEPDGTPGELHARIERHLRGASRPSGPPDATQELHEAIAALRRSLR